MASLTYILVALAALTSTTVLAQTLNLSNISNGTEDYIKIVQSQLLHKIKIAEMENDAVEKRFADQLAVIKLQEQQILNKTQQVNQTLLPLQALNLVRKYCIQTYDSQFVTHQSAKQQFDTCLLRAEQAGENMNSYAKSQVYTAKNYVLNQLFRDGVSCKAYSNQTDAEDCLIRMMTDGVEYVQGKLENARLDREDNVRRLDAIVLKAVKCSFDIEDEVLMRLAFTMKKIDGCVDDLRKYKALDGQLKTLN